MTEWPLQNFKQIFFCRSSGIIPRNFDIVRNKTYERKTYERKTYETYDFFIYIYIKWCRIQSNYVFVAEEIPDFTKNSGFYIKWVTMICTFTESIQIDVFNY